MPRRIPTLGYPSRSEAVLALQARGQSDAQIARAIGIPAAAVSALANSALRSGKRQRHRLDPDTLGQERAEAADRRTVVFYTEALDRLQPAAAARGLHVNELVRLLIDTIVDGNLVGAVLDDQEGTP
jgi:hypothetical protein